MEQVFLKLVHMSLAAGWLVLAVLVLRLLLRRAPRWILCLLWALVALRLVCPLSIESRVSLVPRTATIAEAVFPQEPSVGTVSAEPADPAPAAEQPDTSLTAVLGRAWFAGMVFMLGWALWSDLRLRRRVRASIPQGENVLLCDGIDTPFVLGIFRPRICLPSDLDPAQAVYVLAHENAHIARRDYWWKPLGWVLLSVYWFHPLLWLGYVLLCRDLELACDERVAGGLDREGLAAYSEALLQCSSPRRVSLACPVTFSEVSVKQRVKSILHYKKPGLRLVAVSLIVVFAAGLLFLTDRPVSAAQIPEEIPAKAEPAPLSDDEDRQEMLTQKADLIEAARTAPPPTPAPTAAPTSKAQTKTRTNTNTSTASNKSTSSNTSSASFPSEEEVTQQILENSGMPPMYLSPGNGSYPGQAGVMTNPSSGALDAAEMAAEPANTNTNSGSQSALTDGTMHDPIPLVPGANSGGNPGPSNSNSGVTWNDNGLPVIQLYP